MNETIKNEIKSIYVGSNLDFSLETNVDYATLDIFGDNNITHHLCYLAPDGEIYTTKTEYENNL